MSAQFRLESLGKNSQIRLCQSIEQRDPAFGAELHESLVFRINTIDFRGKFLRGTRLLAVEKLQSCPNRTAVVRIHGDTHRAVKYHLQDTQKRLFTELQLVQLAETGFSDPSRIDKVRCQPLFRARKHRWQRICMD